MTSVTDELIDRTERDIQAQLQSTFEKLRLERQVVAQQREAMRTQQKRIADLEALVKQLRKRSPEDDASTTLTQLQEYIQRMKDKHERTRRRTSRGEERINEAAEEEQQSSPPKSPTTTPA